MTGDKNLLRTLYKGIRANVPHRAERDAEILRRLAETEAYRSCRTLLTYISSKYEPDTRALISLALSQKKTVAVPRDGGGGRMVFCVIDSPPGAELSDMPEMPRPDGGSVIWNGGADGTLCVVPALAYDADGYRLGYGKGYYDRFISENKGVFYIGLCHGECLAERLPRERHDMPVNALSVAGRRRDE